MRLKYFAALHLALALGLAYAQTKVPITIEGVALGKPGVESQVKKLCKLSPPYASADPKRKAWCNFNALPIAPEFIFEGVKGSATFYMSMANGALDKFEFVGDSSNDSALLLSKLEKKLGATARVVIPAASGVGTVAVNRWQDRSGAVLTVSPGGRVEAVSPDIAALERLSEAVSGNAAPGRKTP